MKKNINRKGPILTGIGKLRFMTSNGSYKEKEYYVLLLNEVIKLRSLEGQLQRSINEINERLSQFEHLAHIKKPLSMTDTEPHPATYLDADGVPRILGNGDVDADGVPRIRRNGDVASTSTEEDYIIPSALNNDGCGDNDGCVGGGSVDKNSE